MHAVVTEVTVHTLPFTCGAEDRPWDLTSGPDVYYESFNAQNERLFTSTVADDVRPQDLPFSLPGSFSVQDPAEAHVICLMDSDLIEDEVITSIAFELDGLAADRPDTVCLKTEDTTLELSLEWKDPDTAQS
jgi:hypothetical protein